MKAAQEEGDREAMLAAVRLNWRLWTILQSELLAPECPLPPDLRGNALSLANFIDKHTVAFLPNPAPQKMDVLININRELAAGLYTNPEGGGEEGPGGGGPGGETPPDVMPPSGGIVA